MATGDLHNKFCDDRSSGFRDTLTNRQTDRQTDGLITILRGGQQSINGNEITDYGDDPSQIQPIVNYLGFI